LAETKVGVAGSARDARRAVPASTARRASRAGWCPRACDPLQPATGV